MAAQFGLHAGYSNATLRLWQNCGTEIHPHNLMLPLFLVNDPDAKEDIATLPGVSRWGVNSVIGYLRPLVELGLSSVLLFGVIKDESKDNEGNGAVDPEKNPVIEGVKKIRKEFPSLTIACDVCLCPYASHGHCGVFYEDGTINNAASLPLLAKQALAFAQAGADVVAPSDMMDGRVFAIKKILSENNLKRVSVLSYAVKFASSFYGPFRDAAKSAPAFGDRKCYQLPSGSRGLAARAADRDVAEGADMLMVKPGLAYLDVVRDTKNAHPNHPMFIYQVSGEYSMLHSAAANGTLDLKNALMEVLTCMRRAGADVVISYFTPVVLSWLKN